MDPPSSVKAPVTTRRLNSTNSNNSNGGITTTNSNNGSTNKTAAADTIKTITTKMTTAMNKPGGRSRMISILVTLGGMLFLGNLHNIETTNVQKLSQKSQAAHAANIRDLSNSEIAAAAAAGTTTNVATLKESITAENPLFVLTLPNSGSVALDRYWKCANLEPQEDVARFWLEDPHTPIGNCLKINFESKHKLLARCEDPKKKEGDISAAEKPKYPYRIYSEMEYLQRRVGRRNPKKFCFMPTLQPGFLQQLFQEHPKATVLNVIKDPEEWYATLSNLQKDRWSTLCNDHPGQELLLPPNGAASTSLEWIAFYEQHHHRLRTMIAEQFPSITYIEVDMTKPKEDTALQLEGALDIPQHCWTDAALKPRLPKDVREPIFITSLPKSATNTAGSYLDCGMGYTEGAHQWTKYQNFSKVAKLRYPDGGVTIGNCWQDNLDDNKPMLENCGDHRHWSDFGILVPYAGKPCFYPTIHKNALQAMYDENPYATLFHAVRDATKWYRSANKWAPKGKTIISRWAARCSQFPNDGATEQDWVDFYNWHTEHVRQFAREHPTMTYVEVPIDDNDVTHAILEENFGFGDHCWGHSNVNPKSTNTTNLNITSIHELK